MTIHRSSDSDQEIPIVRGVPEIVWKIATYVIGALIVGLIGNGFVLYAGFDRWARATEQNNTEVRTINSRLAEKDVADVRHELRINAMETVIREIQQRLQVLESRR